MGNVMLRRAARELAYFSFFLLFTIVLLWPHARHLDTSVSDRGDPLHITWIVNWVCYSLTHAPLHIFDAPMFYPNDYPLAYSENFIGIGLVALPFYLLGLPALVVYNIAVTIGYAFAGYAAAVLARQFTSGVPAALIAGIVYGFNPYKVDHLPHLHIIFSGWVPLLLAALVAYRRVPTARNAVLLCAAYVMNGLTVIHWLLYGSVTIGITILFWLVHGTYNRSRRFWVQLIFALVAGVILLIPILIPYRIVSREYKMRRNPGEAEFFSATWSDWLMPGGHSAIYTPLRDENAVKPERALFPGILPFFLLGAAIVLPSKRREAEEPGPRTADRAASRWLRIMDATIIICSILALVGALAKRVVIVWGGVRVLAWSSSDVPFTLALVLIVVRCSFRFPNALGGNEGKSLRTFFARSRFSIDEWSAAVWLAVGVIGSLGMHAFFHAVLFRLQLMRSVRVPARWSIIAYAALAVWAALGVAAILERTTKRRTVAAVLALLCVVDVWAAIRWEDVVADPPLPVYRWMAANRVRIGPVLELPLAGAEFEYLLGSTTHHVPLVNGLSSYEPPSYRVLRERYDAGDIDDRFLALIEQTGCQYLVVHVDLMQPKRDAVLRWLRRNLDRGAVAFVRRFDNGIGGDYVFALTRNNRRWPELRGPQTLDAAGNTPDENLARLLQGKETYSAAPIYWIDNPKVHIDLSALMYRYSDPIHRQLTVSGWALAPTGIRSVDVCVDDSRRCYTTALVPRGDVTKAWPWYPNVARPGFTITLPKRPKGIRRDTDFYLKITDGTGRTMKTSDYQLQWY